MKKYLLGLFAITLAVGFSAFKMPGKLATADFEFTGNSAVQSQVEDPANYQEATISCSNNNEKACRIDGVDELYWHLDGLNNKVLNDQTAEEPELPMTISASAYVDGTTTYYVSTAASFTSIVNKAR